MSGLAIAAEVAAALREAGEAVGNGPMVVILQKLGINTGPEGSPVPGPPTTHPLVAIDQNIMQTDTTGAMSGNYGASLVGTSSRMLMVEATGVIPTKADRVQVRGVWYQIADVTIEATGGVDLFYSLTLRA